MEDIYIEKVKNGDVEAFRLIIRQYQNMAYSVAVSVVKNEFLAQEVVQEAFLNIYQNIKQFRGDSKFSTWLYRIVINRAFRIAEKEGKHTFDSIDTIGEEQDDTVMDELSSDERKYFINEVLMRMPANESLALRLFYLQEMAMNEMQEVTGWSLSNIKVILHRARKKFQVELETILKTEAKSIL
nr:sigma-70 family RNA polymerase sigma factor [uncultured Carboxylicivirga sp.]